MKAFLALVRPLTWPPSSISSIRKGAWFSYKGQRLGQGREAVREELKKNPKLLDEIEQLIMQAYKERPLGTKVGAASGRRDSEAEDQPE